MARRFRRGDLVEVASVQEGFVGSYYEATVVTDLSKHGYFVQYRTLLKDDLSGPLREVASAAEVRPRPPPVPATEYQLHDVVDAFDNDGWWWGRITGRSGDGYTVFFETTGDEIFYHRSRLRTHQEWSNGTWCLAELIPID
ncbi:protein AGENET DOMAIN (AGD)-CONTAINING P1-like [Salvia miltiorrhiza]|uniref:protein AGENET DOMAIN (AGD)-CONTAINING P1-like n=1 Tax=Salvia miltiorrhiza TaxID=226208 RepID=UPI0025ACF97B|nr:protein AGENET DOMAIN (AGD)-CONTAINING P1-like [Salvia miltiorrhiza]